MINLTQKLYNELRNDAIASGCALSPRNVYLSTLGCKLVYKETQEKHHRLVFDDARKEVIFRLRYGHLL